MRLAVLIALASLATLEAQSDPLDGATSMRASIERYRADARLLERRYELPMSEAWVERRERFGRAWRMVAHPPRADPSPVQQAPRLAARD
mgnify:CR=1 FL=1